MAVSKGFRRVDLHHLSQWIVCRILNDHDKMKISLDHYNRSFRVMPDWSRRLAFDRAALCLFHPTEPSTKEAVRYFNDFSYSYDPSRPRSPNHSSDHVALFLNLARRLFEGEDYNTASIVMNFVKQRFPKEVGLLKSEASRNALEIENLQHLQALPLG
jgi:hypothetical protein